LDYATAIEDIKAIIFTADIAEATQRVVDYLYDHVDKYNWVGIYIVEGTNLVLGPWRGKQATEHMKIPMGRGICGSAAQTGKTEIVSDVSNDERYLACFISTRSEIVVPIKKTGQVIGEIDIDSDIPNAFDQNDTDFLETIAELLSSYMS